MSFGHPGTEPGHYAWGRLERLAGSRPVRATGEAAFAAFALALLLTTIDRASSTSLDAPSARWIRKILSGYLPDLVFTGGRLFADGCVGSPWRYAWVAGFALMLILVARSTALRHAALGVVSMVTWGGALGAGLYAMQLRPLSSLSLGWAVVLAPAGALVSSYRGPSGGTLRRLGALLLVVASAVQILLASRFETARAARLVRPERWFVHEPAYDLVVAGTPPVLAFSDQHQLRAVRAPYGPPGSPSDVVLDQVYAERLIPSDDPDSFYLAISSGGARRFTMHDTVQATQYEAPMRMHVASVAEDSVGRNLIVLNEWNGHGAVFRLDVPAEFRPFEVSSKTWPVPWLTTDAPNRVGYVSFMLADGRLRVFDLDTLHLRAERLEIERRIPLAPGTRDVVFDPVLKQVFVNTYPYGLLFRIDARDGRVLETGSCGWRCRSLYVDAGHRTLWAAALEGISRFPLDAPL
jgi:hypothetical protein